MTAANPHRLPSPQHQFQNFPQSSPQVAPQLHSAQQRPTPTTRKSRAFSFRSDKSHGSGSQKIDLHETSAEKEAKRLHSKADPTLAMQEAEPSEVAAYVKSSLASLRSIQHKDAFGNPIADPDRSNPTRSRWERPLDTIRSFEAAIDGGYNNRRSIIRPDGDGSTWGPSRRASYFGPNPNGAGFSRDSYYGSRPPSMMYANRADGSLPDLRMGGHRDSYYEQSQGYGGYGPPAQNGRRGWTGMSSGPQYGAAYKQQQQQNDYSIPNNHRSYETVTTASGSGSPAEPAGYQTDPTSSDNSSIERLHSSVPRRQPEPANDYGIGFGQSPSYQPPSFTLSTPQSASNGGGYGGAHQTSGGGHYVNAPPPVPRKDVGGGIIRKPVTANPGHQARPAQQPEKRKSWFARRFSKNA
ncbi:uncharacterized protein C8A04DRAFT_24242 [Dichotomopilus funicola]|uniref:Uncharacterized protein n=1 Tax=Dichotomopilus funicola TaxID=1934379 RepID=A0AAN6ZQ69_9PEZI|nr:hypothetical protein C8A04DRAFT_24242 [Dichotomopilus funicola]